MATTVDSLLSSLQSHLISQTPLIPALHAQLGLPPTALTDELGELHTALVDCVDRKIGERQQEVTQWMNKCDLHEDECVKLTRALGSHVKNVTGSVGELRKQQVLPKRFEYLTVYQDKLQQLYQAKFEQLIGLTNKINALVHIVGTAFFARDITLPTPAQDVQSDDSQALRDVTPERFSKLEKELVRAKSEISRRLVQLSQTFLQIGWLHEELDIPLPTESETSPMTLSSSGILVMRRSTSASSAIDPFLSASHTLATSTPNTSATSSTKGDDEVLASYHAVFGRFAARLQEASDESMDLDRPGNEAFGVEGVEPTLGLVQWAEGTKTELEDLKARREAHIQAIYNELDTLWRRLGVEEAEMDEFIEANRGSTEANVQAYETEHERMLELKRESMSIFISNARAEIEHLWNELILGDEERGSFAPFVDDEHTEELLNLHETEIQRLKEERRIKAPLLAAIKKYFEICEEEKELTAASSDQSRLLGRGPRDPGRLLREEKMRKRVMKEKPRLEKDLMLSIPTWEDEYDRPFLVNGVSIFEVLSETINASEAGKENRKRARVGSVPPRGTTPQTTGGRAIALTPTQHHEHFGGSTSVPNKRPRLGNSNVANVGGVRPNNATPTFGYGSMTNTPLKPRRGYQVNGVPKSGKTPTSSVPRPAPSARHKHGQPQRGGGLHGHMPTSGKVGVSGYVIPRIPSTASVVSNSGCSIFNAMGGGRNGSRRESFKPRPSVEGSIYDMGASINGSTVGRQWAEFVGRTVKEEEY
ncbi:microtubule associated protein-domain-containing protein [Gautieria morchelliformis]|nr:microtubule associated protein-domain-containing protein [Gautieria morchelliformis]